MSGISTATKAKITEKLEEYCTRFGSQNKAANSLNDVSAANVSLMLNKKWDSISDEMWRKVASQVKYTEHEWFHVETVAYKKIHQVLSDAQQDGMCFAITGSAGSGKSFAVNKYQESDTSKRTYVLRCADYWNRKQFLSELMRQIGETPSGTISEMMADIIRIISSNTQTLIILDEADKLKDDVFYFFITLYNELENLCGIVMLATDFLEKRIRRGEHLNKKGFKEVFSRLGRKFITLSPITDKEMIEICLNNKIEFSSSDDRDKFLKEAERDIRRLRRMVYGRLKAKAVKS